MLLMFIQRCSNYIMSATFAKCFFNMILLNVFNTNILWTFVYKNVGPPIAVAIYIYIFIIYHWIEQKSNERSSHLSLQSVGLFHFPIFNELRICRLRINMFLLYFTWILTRHGLDLNYEYINEDCNIILSRSRTVIYK